MQRYQRHRAIKKLKQLLDAPRKEEELYSPPANMYMTTQKNGSSAGADQDSILEVDQLQRMRETEKVAKLLQGLISKLQSWLYEGEQRHDHSGTDDINLAEQIQAVTRDIDLILQQLMRGVLFTEAEKDTYREWKISGALTSFPLTGHNETMIIPTLECFHRRIASWQGEWLQRKRKLYRIHHHIRDLSLNVHDVRCARISRELRVATTAVDMVVERGIRLFGLVLDNIKIVCFHQ